ncbi:hypothetical protein [Brumimicrobium oceani]|uniref:Outer membrane protein beta-barrel domain-containing protein n=1 Tax=Brumimicrobium oceani TaxID=2100725 RepID=A0A2U2XDP6_9FLAO|nr:hypothetical protein [Brumimicrobium oceani]PWH85925.1 hypothetical protein DIT68_07490 [Brumimicrobium oceani]
MKYLKLSLLLIFFSQPLVNYGQNQDTLGLKRLFCNVIPAVGMEYYKKKVVTDLGDGYTHSTGGAGIAVVGVQCEMGNYWVLDQKKKTTILFRLTWARVGIHNYGLLLAPAQVGLGFHVDFNPKLSLDGVLNAGVFTATDDALYPEFEFDYAVYPQIKLNINHFSIGFEYTFKNDYKDKFSFPKGGHYFGLVLGGTAGKRVN